LTPSGGSNCIRLKSRIRRRRAGVDIEESAAVLVRRVRACVRSVEAGEASARACVGTSARLKL